MRAGAFKTLLGGPGLKVVTFKAQSLTWIDVVPFWTKTNGKPPYVRGVGAFGGWEGGDGEEDGMVGSRDDGMLESGCVIKGREGPREL